VTVTVRNFETVRVTVLVDDKATVRAAGLGERLVTVTVLPG
jgi:hypothetical protein